MGERESESESERERGGGGGKISRGSAKEASIAHVNIDYSLFTKNLMKMFIQHKFSLTNIRPLFLHLQGNANYTNYSICLRKENYSYKIYFRLLEF